MKVIVIEDEPDDALLIERALAKQAALQFAETGAEGAAMVRQGDVDAVILDYLVGDVAGSEILARILAERPGLPVIVASGTDSHFIVGRMVALGAAGFVSKNDPDFAAKLRATLRDRVADSPRREAAAPFAPSRGGKPDMKAIRTLLDEVMEARPEVAHMGVVGPAGVLVQSRVRGDRASQEVAAVVCGNAHTMMSSLARHLGTGDVTALVVHFAKGAVGIAPVTASTAVYLFAHGAQADDRWIRSETSTAARELRSLLKVRAQQA